MRFRTFVSGALAAPLRLLAALVALCNVRLSALLLPKPVPVTYRRPSRPVR